MVIATDMTTPNILPLVATTATGTTVTEATVIGATGITGIVLLEE